MVKLWRRCTCLDVARSLVKRCFGPACLDIRSLILRLCGVGSSVVFSYNLWLSSVSGYFDLSSIEISIPIIILLRRYQVLRLLRAPFFGRLDAQHSQFLYSRTELLKRRAPSRISTTSDLGVRLTVVLFARSMLVIRCLEPPCLSFLHVYCPSFPLLLAAPLQS